MFKYGILFCTLFAVGLAVQCPAQGLYKTKSSTGCRDYIQCHDGKQTVQSCSAFLKAFNPVSLECDWCWRVNCSAPASPWPKPTTPTPATKPTPTQPASHATSKPTSPTTAKVTTAPSKTPATKPASHATSKVTKATPPATTKNTAATKPQSTKAPSKATTTPKETVKTTPKVTTSKNLVNEVTPKPQGVWGKVKHFFGSIF